LPDLTLVFLNRVYFKSPADQIILQMKTEQSYGDTSGSNKKSHRGPKKLP